MSQHEFNTIRSLLSIRCMQCLDIGKVWCSRGPFASWDGRGNYDIMNCSYCSNGHWNNCSHTSYIFARDVISITKYDIKYDCTLLHKHDTYIEHQSNQHAEARMNQLRAMVVRKNHMIEPSMPSIQEKPAEKPAEKPVEKPVEKPAEKPIEEPVEKPTESDESIEEPVEDESIEESDKSEKESEEGEPIEESEEELLERKVRASMKDGNINALWGECLNDSKSITTEDSNLQGELGKLIDTISNAAEAYYGNAVSLSNLIKNIKINVDIHSSQETIEKTKYSKSKLPDGYPVYLFLTLVTSKVSTSCSLLEWCGFTSSQTSITMKYLILLPRNEVAESQCDHKISMITEVRLQRMTSLLMK